jgi:putative oxidoreductase
MRDTLNKHIDIGLLIMRIGLGAMFITQHGGPKIFGGPERWGKVGTAVGNLGIHFFPQFWGFMAGVAEFGGGICLILGILFRPATAFMVITMIVAATSHFARGQGLSGASHAIEVGVALLGLFFIGPGRYSLQYFLRTRLATARQAIPRSPDEAS